MAGMVKPSSMTLSFKEAMDIAHKDTEYVPTAEDIERFMPIVEMLGPKMMGMSGVARSKFEADRAAT